ncbi:AsmA family protein [Leptospira ognonensis]|uniref:AsmA family protein n=1 Tax=Leptospira ognonensis TaxID=2484945 RepID=A0A4R9K5U4_9LEPT|nr:AsmA-like C-terminal region-containing protein [Leptospira ognonensis]TGL59657.1 AsmA family protein [Leptospira ognonensis]
MNFKKTLRYVFGIFSVLLVAFTFLLLGLKQILDQSAVKSLVKEKIEHFVNLNVNYTSVETILFPFPGIEITGLRIEDSSKLICSIESIVLKFDLSRILNQEFQIRSVEISQGEIAIERASDGSFPIQSKFKSDAEELEEGREKAEEGPQALFRLLPKKLKIDGILLIYSDFSNQTHNEFLVKELEMKIDKEDTSIHLNLFGELNKNPINLISVTSLVKNDWNFSSLRTNSQLKMDHFVLSQMGDFIQIFPKAELTDAYFDVFVKLDKESENHVSLEVAKFLFTGVKNKKGDTFPFFSMSTKLMLQSEKQELNLREFKMDYGKIANLSATGEYFKDPGSVSSFRLASDRLDVDKLLTYINLLSATDLSKSNYFKENLDSKEQKKNPTPTSKLPDIAVDLDLHQLVASGRYISFLKGPLEFKDPNLQFKNLQIGIFDGSISATGKFDLKSMYLHTDAKLTGINVEKAIGSATKDKLLKGKLRSNATVDLYLSQKGRPQTTLRLKSAFHIDKGQLLGYANFIKPVAEVGKLFNFSGASGDSTSFESIDGSILLINQRVQLHSFEMKGVGLNATGSGVYDQGGKIDMKFTVALAGVVGRAVKLPIIYRGYYGKNFAFIDPVWLATVYTGTMLGGPLGTVLGSMAGSKASEKVDETIGGVKNTFQSIKGFFTDDKPSSKTTK